MISSQDGTEARRPRWLDFLLRPRAGGSAGGCSAAAGLGSFSGWRRWAAGAVLRSGGADGAGGVDGADAFGAGGAAAAGGSLAAGDRVTGGRGGTGVVGPVDPPRDAACAATRIGSGTLSSAGSVDRSG